MKPVFHQVTCSVCQLYPYSLDTKCKLVENWLQLSAVFTTDGRYLAIIKISKWKEVRYICRDVSKETEIKACIMEDCINMKISRRCFDIINGNIRQRQAWACVGFAERLSSSPCTTNPGNILVLLHDFLPSGPCFHDARKRETRP